jgi:hypothetical protein
VARAGGSQTTLLWAISLGLLVLIVALAFSRFQTFEARIQALETRQEELKLEINIREKENASLRLVISDRDKEIAGLYKPIPIDGPAEFPISRVLARAEDTVASLARREKTTSEVVLALNPWLGEERSLFEGQAIWVPNP